MLKKLFLACAAIFMVSFLAYADESITITTYYPSPYGSYNELRATRMAIGSDYINSVSYCWSGSCTNTIPAATNLIVEGNVGIGTTTNPLWSPNNLLQVYQLINFDNTLGNTSLGYQAGINNINNNNTAVGCSALKLNTGQFNSAVGNNALAANTTGSNNTAMGMNALGSLTQGGGNSAVGTNCLSSNSIGNFNSAVGYLAAFYNTGSDNIAVGAYSLYLNNTGSDNTIIGYNAATNANSDSNEIVIGSGATGIGSNSAVLGSSSITKTELFGDVGIGQPTPTNKLEIIDTTSAGSRAALNVSQSAAMSLGYAGYFSKTGASTTNVGLYTTASGATNNYGLIVASGNVGIGTTTPQGVLDVNGTQFNEVVTTGYALCFTAGHQLGHCTSTPTNGACTCSAN